MNLASLVDQVQMLGKENRRDLLDQFLTSLQEEEKRYCYEKLQSLLSVDFVPRLPVETIDLIFGKLSALELLMASMACKRWRKHALRAPLWAQLCKNRKWLKLEKYLLNDLSPKQFESEAKYRRLYYRATKLRKNWRNGDYKNLTRSAHRHRVEALDHWHGLTVSGGRDQQILVENEFDPKKRFSISTSTSINALAVANNLIVCGTQDGAISLYNATTQKKLETFQFFDERPIEFVRIAQKDKFAIATGGNRIKVISLTGSTSLFEHSVSEDELTEIASISVIDGKCLVAGWSGLIKVLNLHNFEWIELASENDEAAISSDIDKTLSRAVTGGSEGTVRGWNLLNGHLLFIGRASDQDIYAISCRNSHIATGCREGVIRLWSWTGQQLKIMKEHIGSIRCLQIHENFDILISAGDAKFLCLWDINNGELLKRVHRNSINVNQMVTSPTHLILAGPNDPGQIATYDYQSILTEDQKAIEEKFFG